MEQSESAQRAQLVQSVVDFTGLTPNRAEKILQETNWNVPEAVTKFFLQTEAVPAYRQGSRKTGVGLLVQSILEAIKSCMGWSWSILRLFLFGPGSTVKTGTGNLAPYFNSFGPSSNKPNCFDGSFKDACTLARSRDNRKVLIVFLHSQSSADFEHSVRSVLLDESVVSMINAQFLFWAGDVEYIQAQQLLRALPLRTTPLFLALVSQNTTEIKIVGACGGSGFSLESALMVLQKAQEEQDRLFAEDEQFRINRDLREAQDREYEEALQCDREEEERRAAVVHAAELAAKTLAERKSQVKQSLDEIVAQWFATTKDASHLVVKLPQGKRIEAKFKLDTKIGIVYEWVACTCDDEFEGKKFTLSTSFPSTKLDREDEKNLTQLALVPNAVLLCSVIDSDSE